jgi:hypothetical protein
VGTELFHADRQADMNLIVAFRNVANVPKNRQGRDFAQSQPSNAELKDSFS